jgi:DNA polymerase-3 subunit gamma/tau
VSEQEGINISDDALYFIADRTKGAMRDALRDLGEIRAFGTGEEVTAATLRERFGFTPEKWQLSTLDVLIQMNRSRAYVLENKLYEEGADYHKYFLGYIKTLNDLLKVREGVPVTGWSESAAQGLEERKNALAVEELIMCIRLAMDYSEYFKSENPPQVVFSTYFQQAITNIGTMRGEPGGN